MYSEIKLYRYESIKEMLENNKGLTGNRTWKAGQRIQWPKEQRRQHIQCRKLYIEDEDEKFEDIEGVFRNRKSKNRQYNGQQKKDKQ